MRGWRFLELYAVSSLRGRATEPAFHAVTAQWIDFAPLFTLERHGVNTGSSLHSSGRRVEDVNVLSYGAGEGRDGDGDGGRLVLGKY